MSTPGDLRPQGWPGAPIQGLRLWYAVLAGIPLWMVHLTALSSLVDLSCDHDRVVWVMHGITAALMLATAAALGQGVQLLRATAGSSDEAAGLLGRLRFLAVFGILTSGISLVLILWEGAYVPFLDRCA